MPEERALNVLLVGNEKQNDLNVYVGGRNGRIVRGVSSGPNIRDFYDIEYCISGGFTLYLNGKPYEISAGDLHIVPPLTHTVRHFHAEETSTVYIGVKGINLGAYLKAVGLSEENIVFPYKVTEDCVKLLEKTVDSLEVSEYLEVNDPSDNLAVDLVRNDEYTKDMQYKNELRQAGCCMLFLSELMRIFESHQEKKEKESVQQVYVQLAVRYIEANYHLKITVDDIAKHVGVTRSYLFKLFRQEKNISVQDYIIQVRMKNACNFLVQPGALVKNIADVLGYDPFSFSRIFKKTIGLSPSEYQKKNRKQ